MILSLIVAAFYASGFASAINAVMTARTAQGAIAWTAALVAFPFVAVPAYWVLGRSKFEGFIAAYEENKDTIDALAATARRNMKIDQVHFDTVLPEYEAMRGLSGNSLTSGNRAELLINGEATFDSILRGIADAREYVLVQFYMIHDDGLGRRLQQALIERAEAGVRVFVLYDEIGSSGLPRSYSNALEAAGVRVSSFKPNQGSLESLSTEFSQPQKDRHR